MKFYNKETWNDRWIVEDVFRGREGGFFVEAGAQHGKWGSCTYVLEKDLGWTGILIEPVDSLFDKLVKFRPNSTCINACLSDTNKEVDFIQYKDEIGFSGIPEHWGPNRTVNPETSAHEKTKKPGITLKKILDDHHAPKVIDYLAMDIERAETAVLNAFPFDEYAFKVISLEGGQGAFNTLAENDYIRVGNPFCRHPWESYFVHKKWVQITYKV